ncbi:hypothetical protein T02_7454 [Trichinella nativa]|uniref:Uncharacterized protein n=1 Tax=Trichinella nativa TaxID=6335 RepID=A0A0V1KQE0_9BILA|nr:hypothetical protein T02_7454 [Trichinella nativa]
MPSEKRQTERKGNAPVNTGPSPNSDGCTNNTVEEAEEHFLTPMLNEQCDPIDLSCFVSRSEANVSVCG